MRQKLKLVDAEPGQRCDIWVIVMRQIMTVRCPETAAKVDQNGTHYCLVHAVHAQEIEDQMRGLYTIGTRLPHD
jgi:hypothetical protein